MAEHSASEPRDVQSCVVAALEAMNGDPSETGFSPAQMVLGKQPRGFGQVVRNDRQARLSQHGLIENDPSFAQIVAMEETAQLALVRLTYSQALRRARWLVVEGLRAMRFSVGDVVYF